MTPLQWRIEEVHVLLAQIRRELNNPSIHSYQNVYVNLPTIGPEGLLTEVASFVMGRSLKHNIFFSKSQQARQNVGRKGYFLFLLNGCNSDGLSRMSIEFRNEQANKPSLPQRYVHSVITVLA